MILIALIDPDIRAKAIGVTTVGISTIGVTGGGTNGGATSVMFVIILGIFHKG